MHSSRYHNRSGPNRVASFSRAAVFVATASLVFVRVSSAQTPAAPSTLPAIQLTLDDAIGLAESRSEQVAIAEAGVERARGDEVRARANLLPQLTGSASYNRTLASEFSSLFSSTPTTPACAPFSADASAPVQERVAEIERAIGCGAVGNPFSSGSFNNLPFGRTNVYSLNLSFAQNLYTGGRISGQRALAAAGRETADVSLTSTRAQLSLDVTQAYYDAALSERFVAIAEAALQQAESTLAQVELSFRAGQKPEFDALRARVTRDNQRPLVIRSRANRTLAYLRLKQLLEIPPEQAVELAVDLENGALPPPARFAEALARMEAGLSASGWERRAPIRQAEFGVQAGEASLRLARSQRLPTVNFNSSYGRVAYPSGVPSFSDFLTNWTIGVAAQLPILTGGRIAGDERSARAQVSQAEAQLKLTRELALLDSSSAYEELSAARASWEASAGTVEQALRAYDIAELRYREGVSTELELSDARLQLEQAQANRAQAARDLQVARARLALLPDLPLSSGGAGSATTMAAGQAGANPLQAGTASAGSSSSLARTGSAGDAAAPIPTSPAGGGAAPGRSARGSQ